MKGKKKPSKTSKNFKKFFKKPRNKAQIKENLDQKWQKEKKKKKKILIRETKRSAGLICFDKRDLAFLIGEKEGNPRVLIEHRLGALVQGEIGEFISSLALLLRITFCCFLLLLFRGSGNGGLQL